MTAYRVAFGDRRAQIGPQEREIGGTRIWALPNPSGLNAQWTLPRMAEEFGRLREAAGAQPPPPPHPHRLPSGAAKGT